MRTLTLSAKTSELIIYVASKLRKKANYNSALLANSLFLVDYMNYSKTGKPISDLSYVKEKEGIVPSPQQFVQIKDYLERENRDANFDVFGKEEVKLIEEVLNSISERTSEISNYTKSLLAWTFAEYNEEIPFYTFQYVGKRN